jgi:hypothetical protein
VVVGYFSILTQTNHLIGIEIAYFRRARSKAAQAEFEEFEKSKFLYFSVERFPSISSRVKQLVSGKISIIDW